MREQGYCSDTPFVEINGGDVTASSTSDGAGIGSGFIQRRQTPENAAEKGIRISCGTVTAYTHTATGLNDHARALLYGGFSFNFLSSPYEAPVDLHDYQDLKMTAGLTDKDALGVNQYDENVNYLNAYQYIKIEPCNHEGATFTDKDDYTHDHRLSALSHTFSNYTGSHL